MEEVRSGELLASQPKVSPSEEQKALLSLVGLGIYFQVDERHKSDRE